MIPTKAISVEVNFTIPADNVPAALMALNILFKGEWKFLNSALFNNTRFYGTIDEDENFTLADYRGTWTDETESVIVALGTFASEGSYIRFRDEHTQRLWGYRVVRHGGLREEAGEIQWTLIPLEGKKCT